MESLESQVTDLNYLLVDNPLTAGFAHRQSDRGMDSQQQPQSADSPADEGGKGSKRKADEVDQPAGAHTRAKRNRYISVACNECKRRKIKCNGNTPCQRCGNLNLECQYASNCCTNFKDTDDFRQMTQHIRSLQEQVDSLFASLNAMRGAGDALYQAQPERSVLVSQQPPISPVRHRPVSRHSQFHGPTSTAFSLDVAKKTLHSMGYQGLGNEGADDQDALPATTTQISPPPTHVINPRDPIWSIGREEAVRLCRVYEEEMGLMYPVVNIDKLIDHARNLFDFKNPAVRSGLRNSESAAHTVSDEQSLVLKIVLACATVVEGSGQSDIGYRLFECVKDAADRTLHSEVIEVKNLPFLVLVAIYHFHCDEEALAWRIIGQVARMCIELGLHRRESLFKVVPNEKERAEAIALFWSIYVLDRRWSFGTGMPFALQDTDIDPGLPEPELSIPYLNVMIAYFRIGSKVWKSICSFSSTLTPALSSEEIGYLDYQILQWQKSIPPSLQLPTTSSQPPTTRALHRLQILLYLRSNQMRILIYRPVLHSASSIQEHPSYAGTVVDLAKDTIRALTHLNQTTDIYRVQQVCFNYFLISALAVIFLASCHAPVQFSASCREEFYMALDLVKSFSTKSFVSKRLWHTIRDLKEVAPKLGLSQEGAGVAAEEEDPHSSAAMAMAGLAGHEISGMGFGENGSTAVSGDPAAAGVLNQGEMKNGPMNGFQMSHEMNTLFEAALGSVRLAASGNTSGGNGPANYGDVRSAGYNHLADCGASSGDGMAGVGSNVFGGEEELYRHLGRLF